MKAEIRVHKNISGVNRKIVACVSCLDRAYGMYM